MVMATATRHNLEGWAVRFEADVWYSEYALRIVLGWDEDVLARARRAGLRYAKVGRSRLYRGAWLDEWLSRCEGP
jgi:hypothetical protein